MKLLASWKDSRPRTKAVNYRLLGDRDWYAYVIERQEQDNLGGEKWVEVDRWGRDSGDGRGTLHLLADAVEQFVKTLEEQTEKIKTMTTPCDPPLERFERLLPPNPMWK